MTRAQPATPSNRGRRLARRCAVQALYQWRLTAQSPEIIEQSFIADAKLRGKQRAYFLHLIAEIPKHIAQIDALIAPHLDRQVDAVDILEQAIIRLGAYELAFAGEVPTRVVINEGVELAKLFCAQHGYRYVNAVLDRLARAVRNDAGGEMKDGNERRQ